MMTDTQNKPDGVAAHFSSIARLQAMLHVEAALADAEASVGVIPRAAAEAIRRAARASCTTRSPSNPKRDARGIWRFRW